MKKAQVVLKHQIVDPRNRMNEAAAFYQAKYPANNIKLVWNGDSEAVASFHVLALTLIATFRFSPGEVLIEMHLPGLLSVWHDRALNVVKEEAAQWLKP